MMFPHDRNPPIAGVLLALLFPLLAMMPARLAGQTLYATVLGNQKYVVGSSTLHSGLFRSSDTGRTWEHLGPENLKTYSMDAIDSSRGRILYIAAGNGVHRSTDFGRTWKIITGWRMTEVMDLAVDQRDPRTIYAATAFGFWRSTDGGTTWENPAGLLAERYVRAVKIHDGEIAATGSDTLYRSNDRGTTWRATARITDRQYDTAVIGRWRYTAGVKGIAKTSTDNPGQPVDITDDLPNRVVHAIATVGDALIAGTFGDGLFRLKGGSWKPSGLPGSQIWRLVVKPW
ncbi:MAG: glycosyl hydrolase, repeat-containing protein [Chlorobi bacterium]|nr:glycosyl hydrolase, repeat-containing protein [Chlorobiota bacterium]